MFHRSPVLSLYHIDVRTRWLLDQPISAVYAQATAKIICARLCLVRHSPFASLMYPATTCSIVSEYWIHVLQLQSPASPLASFHDLVFIICSNIVLIAAVSPGLRFWDNHTWHCCSCPLYNLLGYSFVPYSTTLWFFTPFSIFSFNLFHAGFHFPLIISPSILMLPSSNWISTPTSSIVLIASSTIEFCSLVFSLLRAVLIHLIFVQAM